MIPRLLSLPSIYLLKAEFSDSLIKSFCLFKRSLYCFLAIAGNNTNCLRFFGSLTSFCALDALRATPALE